jgi:hypothetical protein
MQELLRGALAIKNRDGMIYKCKKQTKLLKEQI